IQLYVKNVNISKSFEQNGLAFHDGLCGQRADVAQPKYGCAIGDDRDKVSLRGIFEYLLGSTLDLPAWLGDPRRVRHRKISLSKTWLCRFDFDFSGSIFTVIFKNVTFPNHLLLLVAELETLTVFNDSSLIIKCFFSSIIRCFFSGVKSVY